MKILLGTRRSSRLQILTVKKIDDVLLHAKQAQRGGRDIGLPVLDAGARRGLGGQRHVPADLPPGKTPCAHEPGGWMSLGVGLDSGRSRPTGIRTTVPSGTDSFCSNNFF